MGLLIRQVYILDVAGRTIPCVDVVCYSYNYRKTYADVQHRAVIIHQPRAMRKRIMRMKYGRGKDYQEYILLLERRFLLERRSIYKYDN